MNSSDSQRSGFRSPLLMNANDTALVVIDVQQKLLPHISQARSVQWNLERLLQAAEILGVTTVATEQYPKGLGSTVPAIQQLLERTCKQPVPEKMMFSCRNCHEIMDPLQATGIHKLLLAGIETHVCVAQTALDLSAAGFDIYLAVDAVGSRFETDHHTALRRLESSGCTLTTTETAMFEWCEVAGTESFKQISKLVQQQRPDD